MFTSIRKYKVTRGSAEDLARRVQRVSNQTANLQTNELSAKERLNRWPGVPNSGLSSTIMAAGGARSCPRRPDGRDFGDFRRGPMAKLTRANGTKSDQGAARGLGWFA